jgi:transcriptional regulator with XRE-family HTH domain
VNPILRIGFSEEQQGMELSVTMGSRRDSRTAYVDSHVGGRLRERRILLGLSQTRLGESLGLSFQQIQKYERGIDRISVGRLVHLAHVLEVPITYFFEELDEPGFDEGSGSPARLNLSLSRGEQAEDPMSKRETLELVRAYYQIEQPELRKHVFALIRSIATKEH